MLLNFSLGFLPPLAIARGTPGDSSREGVLPAKARPQRQRCRADALIIAALAGCGQTKGSPTGPMELTLGSLQGIIIGFWRKRAPRTVHPMGAVLVRAGVGVPAAESENGFVLNSSVLTKLIDWSAGVFVLAARLGIRAGLPPGLVREKKA